MATFGQVTPEMNANHEMFKRNLAHQQFQALPQTVKSTLAATGGSYNTSTGQYSGGSSSGGAPSGQTPGGGITPDGSYSAGYHGAPSQEEINRQIDEAYNSSYDYLNQAESAVRADHPNVLSEAQKNYDVNAQLLGSSKTSGLNQLGEQGLQASQTNETAQAKARRLYNELRTGYQQRFGGASSAGQAATEISGVEQQRQQGQLNQQYAQTVRQIDLQKADIGQKYNDGILQLEQQKQVAINQANRDFQQKLLEIANNRAQIGAAKAQAKLQALQELRNQVFQINQQTVQFKQTLAAQVAQANGQLTQYAQQVLGATQAGKTAVTAYNPNPTSNAQAYNTNTTSPTNQYVGAITSPRRPQEEYGLPSLYNTG